MHSVSGGSALPMTGTFFFLFVSAKMRLDLFQCARKGCSSLFDNNASGMFFFLGDLFILVKWRVDQACIQYDVGYVYS